MIDQPARRTAAAKHSVEPPWRRRAAIAAGAGAVTLTVALAVIQVLPARYTATSVVSFAPRVAAMAPGDTLQLVSQKYVVIATSSSILQAAADKLGLEFDEIATGTTAALSPASVNLEITVELPERDQAVAAANTIATLVVDRASTDELTVVEQTASAVPSQAVSKPPRPLFRVVSTVASILLAGLVWTVLAGRARRSPATDAAPATALATAPVPGPGQPSAPSAFGEEAPPRSRRPGPAEDLATTRAEWRHGSE